MKAAEILEGISTLPAELKRTILCFINFSTVLTFIDTSDNDFMRSYYGSSKTELNGLTGERQAGQHTKQVGETAWQAGSRPARTTSCCSTNRRQSAEHRQVQDTAGPQQHQRFNNRPASSGEGADTTVAAAVVDAGPGTEPVVVVLARGRQEADQLPSTPALVYA